MKNHTPLRCHIKGMGFLAFFLTLLFLLQTCTGPARPNTVHFPEVSEAVPITSGPSEHLYASYYGINSFSEDGRYATVLQTDIRDTIPTEDQPATLGMVDLETMKFVPLTRTRAWNFQQGCMAHWLGTNPDSLIIYNDLREGKFVSVVMNVHARTELRTIPYPVSAVSPDGTRAISINFARLRLTRPDYGYGGGGQDAQADLPFPENDGLYLVDLQTGEAELLVSIADVMPFVKPVPEGGMEYFNHTLISRDGSKVFWLARARPQRNTVSMTVNLDGSALQPCFPQWWGGSHFDWLDGERLMITASYENKGMAHILFTVGAKDYRRLGNGLLDYDGHGTFSPDGKWMLTDTYPQGELQEQKLYLMDMKTEAVLPLGRFVQPPSFTAKTRGSRCDLHPRWSSSGDLFGFNSTYTGSRQCYIMRFKY